MPRPAGGVLKGQFGDGIFFDLHFPVRQSQAEESF